MGSGIPEGTGTTKLSEVLFSSLTPDLAFADSQGKNREGDFIIH